MLPQVKQITSYLNHSAAQRQSQLESSAALTTSLLELRQELASVKAERDDLKKGSKELKRVVERLEKDKGVLQGEMKDVKVALAFARQKEQAALASAERTQEEVERVREKAAGRVEGMKRRLEALEVQGYLQGGGGLETVETVDEAAEVVRTGRARVGGLDMDMEKEVTSVVAPRRDTGPVVASRDQNQQQEYRIHRSEMGLLERKLEKSNGMLAKTMKAAQKIQDKLMEERCVFSLIQLR